MNSEQYKQGWNTTRKIFLISKRKRKIFLISKGYCTVLEKSSSTLDLGFIMYLVRGPYFGLVFMKCLWYFGGSGVPFHVGCFLVIFSKRLKTIVIIFNIIIFISIKVV